MKFIKCLIIFATLAACEVQEPSSDQKQSEQQEKILEEGTAQTGMPAITKFHERKLMKSIIEMRDQDGLTTYTYTFSEVTGKFSLICNSIGYGLPAATQYTSPQHVTLYNRGGSYFYEVLPQADPNGLFSPSSAEGTWVLCKDPNGPDVKPLYIEPRITVSPFKLSDDVVTSPSVQTKKETSVAPSK